MEIDEKIRVLGNVVAVEPDPFPDNHGHVVLPEAFIERPEHRFWKGTVRVIGPGRWVRGKRKPMDVRVGERVWYERNAGTPIVNGWAVLYEDAILLAGPDVDKFDLTPKHGIRADGSRV